MRALHREVVPPSGVEYCASLNLIGTTVFRKHGDGDERPKAVHNLVVARSNLLRIYEIQEDTAQVQSQPGREKDKWTRVRRDTEAVEGEVEMDTQGEGFVNMGTVKVVMLHYIIFVISCHLCLSCILYEMFKKYSCLLTMSSVVIF